MVCRDANTGKLVGKHSIYHPNVISGQWVHHRKGYKMTKDERMKYSRPGHLNGRYSGYTDEDILQFACEASIRENRILCYNEILRKAQACGMQFPKSLSKFRFNGKGKQGLRELIEKQTGMRYKIYRSAENRNNIRNSRLEYLKNVKNHQNKKTTKSV